MKHIAGGRKPHAKESKPSVHIVQQVTAFGGIALFMAVATKVLSVAHLDLTTALTLATGSAPSTVLLGSLLLFYPALVSGACFLAMIRSVKLWTLRKEHLDSDRLRFWIAIVVLTTPVVLAAIPVVVLGWWVGSFVLAVSFEIARRTIIAIGKARRVGRVRARILLAIPAGWKEGSIAAASFILLMIATAPMLLTVFNDVVWLPPVKYSFDSAPHSQVGYEVNRDDNHVVLLDDLNRRVYIRRVSSILSEQPCRMEKLVNNGQSLLAWLDHDALPPTPRCY